MKKIVIFILLLVLIVLLTSCSAIREDTIPINELNELEVNDFSIKSYEWEINNFPSDKKVDKIQTASDAAQKAHHLMSEEFGRMYIVDYVSCNAILNIPTFRNNVLLYSYISPNQYTDFIEKEVLTQQPMCVYYDSLNDCWMITFSFPENSSDLAWTGVMPTVFIEGNGTVLSICMT